MSRFAPETLPAAGPCDCRTVPPHAPQSLTELVDHEALAYRAWGTPEGDFLARQMERLAQLIRWTGATTPEDHDARMEVWEDEIRDQQYYRGLDEGLARAAEGSLR